MSAQYGIVGRLAVDNKECNILSNLLRVVTDRYGHCDHIEGVYPRSSEPNERCVGWHESLLLDPHLLECLVVEDTSRASIIN